MGRAGGGAVGEQATRECLTGPDPALTWLRAQACTCVVVVGATRRCCRAPLTGVALPCDVQRPLLVLLVPRVKLLQRLVQVARQRQLVVWDGLATCGQHDHGA
jgi:hypothetical protein